MPVSEHAVKSFHIPVDAKSSVEIKITEPHLRADNLTLTTWTSSYILACQLHKLDIPTFDDDDEISIPILELGAGTGVVSLSAAAIWKRKPILTDLEGIVPGLRDNVNVNATVLQGVSIEPEYGTLDWRSPETLTLEDGRVLTSERNKANIIFAADTIYDEGHPELLSTTIFQWLKRSPNARVILTYPLRVCYLNQIRETWSVLEAGGLIAEQDGQETADRKDWDDECLCEWVVWKWKTP